MIQSYNIKKNINAKHCFILTEDYKKFVFKLILIKQIQYNHQGHRKIN